MKILGWKVSVERETPCNWRLFSGRYYEGKLRVWSFGPIAIRLSRLRADLL